MKPPDDTTRKTLLDLPDSLYFDRPSATQDLINNLTRNFFVSIIGESGSGKSSLVNLGLVQELQKGKIQGRAGNDWRIVQTNPFADPLGNLAGALCKPGALFDDGARDADFRIEVEDRLRENDESLSELYNEALLASNKAFNLLIVVDQKQELYRYQSFLQKSKKAFDDVRYINLLLNAYRSKAAPIYIIIISDSRYFEFFAKYRGLPEAMNNFGFPVPPIKESEIRAFVQRYLPDKTEEPDRYQEEFDFMDRILLDFKAFSGDTEKVKKDPFALQKLNLCLSMVLDKRRLQKDEPEKGTLLDIYNKIGGLESTIQYIVKEEIFTNERFNPKQKKRVKLLFQALTGKDGNNQYIRRPVTLQELSDLTKPKKGEESFRDESLSIREVWDLLKLFNGTRQSFVRLPEPNKLSPDSIIDIDSDSLLTNWPELAKWIEQESTNAYVYQNLVKDAIAYYAPGELPGKKEQESPVPEEVSAESSNSGFDRLRNMVRNLLDHTKSKETSLAPGSDQNLGQRSVYEGATLVSASRWYDEGTHNETWAAPRYAPEKPELTKIQESQLAQSFKDKGMVISGLTNLVLAETFLKESVLKFQDALDVERGNVKRADKQRRIATISAIVSVVLGLFAIFFWVQAHESKRNIQLIDFVEVLEYNGVLDIQPSERFTKMNKLIDKVVKTKGIKSPDHVLNFLHDQGVITREPVAELKELQYRSLKNINDLYLELKTIDTDHEKSIAEIDQIFAAVKKYDQQHPGRQFPWLYYALSAQIFEIQKDMDLNYPQSTAIEGGAMAASQSRSAYAFGDKNGSVILRTSTDRTSLPNADGVIKGLGFSQNGNTLVVGTELGGVFLYDSLNLPKGIPSSMQTNKRHPIFMDPLRKSMYFVKLWPDDPETILICNTFKVYFIKKEEKSKSYKLYGQERELPQQRVVCREWLPEDSLFLASGRDRTIIYRLQPNDPNHSIEEIGWINHDSTTITSLALKSEQVNGERKFWLAMGSETGQVWIANNLTSLQGHFDVADFQYFGDLHETTISSMAFNPGMPQLASASIDGVIRFWNLSTIGENNNDDIVLRNYGQGVSSIAYVNKNELAVHQDLYDWVIKTNVTELMTQMNCLRKTPNCINGFSQ